MQFIYPLLINRVIARSAGLVGPALERILEGKDGPRKKTDKVFFRELFDLLLILP